jgi:hypothetical protein
LFSVAGELVVLTHNQEQSERDQQTRDEQHKREIANLLKHFSDVESLLTSENRVIAARARTGIEPPTPTLKMRALDLSQEILQFLVSRQVTPGYGEGGFGAGPYGGVNTADNAYQKQTGEIFAASFQNRVLAMRDAFAKQGLVDEQLNVEIRDPATAYSIRDIAERVSALAEKIK